MAEVGEDQADRRTRMAADLIALDVALYEAAATVPTHTLDVPLRRLSHAADYSTLWLGIAGLTALAGGAKGRRVALKAVAAIAINSFTVNVVLKRLQPRDRPLRAETAATAERHIPMPTSSSFPSGHSASAFAFAEVVSHDLPLLGVGCRFLAGAVAYSRVHTGVHYPLDVVVGSIVGATIGSAVVSLSDRLGRRS